MTAEELMRPRFEVIADYPYCPVKVNEQLEKATETLFIIAKTSENETVWHLSEIEKYPHLFRKLNWWEKRNIEDMPKNVKAVDIDEVYEIYEWDIPNMVGYLNSNKAECCNLLLPNPEYGYFPVD